MHDFNKITVLAITTFRSCKRQKITTFLLIIIGLSIALGLLMSTVDIGIRFRLFENILISTQIMVIHGLAWIYAFEVMRRETYCGLFVLPLSTSLKRHHYILGKFIGINMIIGLFCLLMVFLDFTLLSIIEHQFRLPILWQIILSFFSAFMTVSLFYFFSTITSAVQALLYTISCWFIGHGLDELYLFVTQNALETIKPLIYALYLIFPNFSFFDMTSEVLATQTLNQQQVFFPVIYSLGYSSLLLFFTARNFKQKSLLHSE